MKYSLSSSFFCMVYRLYWLNVVLFVSEEFFAGCLCCADDIVLLTPCPFCSMNHVEHLL